MEQRGRKGFWPDFGTLALAAMIMGIVLTRSTAYALKGVGSRSLAIAGLCVFLGSELTAVILGILALCGVGRKEGRTDVWRGVVAIVFGGLLLVCVPVGMWTMLRFAKAQKKVAAKRRRKELQELERMGQDAVLEYPGWLGVVEALGATIVVTSAPDDSPISRELNSYWEKDVSLISVGISRARDEGEISLDPSSVRLVMPDGTQRRCLPTVEVYRTAKEEKGTWLARFSGNVRASAGETLASGWAFFPRGTDFSRVESVVVSVNGEDIVVQGAFLSSARKKELFSLGQEMQRAADQ